eukprot:6172542-Pleurochrysis_carterae.AAC.1
MTIGKLRRAINLVDLRPSALQIIPQSRGAPVARLAARFFRAPRMPHDTPAFRSTDGWLKAAPYVKQHSSSAVTPPAQARIGAAME